MQGDRNRCNKEIKKIYFEGEEKLYLYNGYGEECKSPCGSGGTIFAKKTIFQDTPFLALNETEDGIFFIACQNKNIDVYAGSKFNYIYKRHFSMKDHTWIADEDELKKYCLLVDLGSDIEAIAST